MMPADALQPSNRLPRWLPARRLVRKLRLLIVSPYFPPHVGGLEGYVSDLNDALLAYGGVERITVFTPMLPAEAGAEAVESRSDRYLVLRYPAFELIPNFPIPKLWTPAFWRSVRISGAREHDVLLSHTRFFLTSALALAWSRAVHRPLLHVEHGSDYVQLSRSWMKGAARIYDHGLGRLLLRRADAVVAISYAAAAFVRRLAARDAVVIHRGMWPAQLDVPPDGQVLERARGRCVVTFAGRLIDGKGVPDLLRAFAAVAGIEALACIVGDGPRRAELESLARELGISERVVFLGYVPEARARAVIRASDIVVNPSYTEGLPTAVLEAALMGKAVLATDVGGTPEIVSDGDSALLVAPRDVEALRARLEQLLADKRLRERLGDAARAQARGGFDWQACARQYTEILRELTAARRAEGAQRPDALGAASTSSNADS
jgi:glycosyltransferase involved in cell wall biosynthesis